MNREELEKMVYNAEVKHIERCESINYTNAASFKTGASFVTGILMPELERLNECTDRNASACLIAIEENFKAKARIDELTIDRDFTNAQCITRDQKIQYLKDENERMREVIKCCDSDYWFMINLIEHYSTDKDQALKDCLERMKFRKPMFKAAMKESGGK